MPYPFLHIFYAENNFILNFLPLSASYQPKISIIFQFYFADKKIADTVVPAIFIYTIFIF